MLGELQRLVCKMDIVSLLEEFVDLIRNEEVEVYNEFSLQHELGIFLRAKLTGNKVQFERNVKFFGITGTVKHEIDIVIYNENEKYAIELKYPLNGQYPEQMYSFVKDIKFMEQLKEAGFYRNPHMILKTIACEGKVLEPWVLMDEIDVVDLESGIKKPGTFHFICRECDALYFQDYENKEALLNDPTDKMLAEAAIYKLFDFYSQPSGGSGKKIACGQITY